MVMTWVVHVVTLHLIRILVAGYHLNKTLEAEGVLMSPRTIMWGNQCQSITLPLL